MGVVLIVVALVVAMKIGIGLFIYSRMKAEKNEGRQARQMNADPDAG